MKFIHLASFSGNIGDIANHEGFYSSVIGDKVSIKQLEIRKFYKNCNELCFDKKLLSLINNYDALILGGGGFFDIRWEKSWTGTTFDMDESFIRGIRVPVLINAMGVHPDYRNKIALSHFRDFFNTISNLSNWMITLRNDGSLERLRSIMGKNEKFYYTVPDNGFVFDKIQYNSNNNTVGLLITKDLFEPDYNGRVTYDKFILSMIEICKRLLKTGKELLFFLHTPQDIDVLHTIYSGLGNEQFREKIKIAPYDTSSLSNTKNINRLYSQCKYVISMRFHGNVIAVKNEVPVIGLSGHEQIQGLFHDINLDNQCIVVKDGFEDKLVNLIEAIEHNPERFSMKESKIMLQISNQHKEYTKKVREFLKL